MPQFIWTEKEGRPTLERGVSTLTTIPEFPTFPFHFDLPSCIAYTPQEGGNQIQIYWKFKRKKKIEEQYHYSIKVQFIRFTEK
jgi:hypothetical protein